MELDSNKSDSNRRNSEICKDSKAEKVSEILKSQQQDSISKSVARGSTQDIVRNIHLIEEQHLDSNSGIFEGKKLLNVISRDREGSEFVKNMVDQKDENRRLNEKCSGDNRKMNEGEYSKYLNIKNMSEAIQYQNKKEDASKESVNIIAVDNCIDDLHADIMNLGAEEMSNIIYEQTSSRQEREREYNSAKQSYRDYLDLVHDSLETSFRDSLQNDTEISISRTHKVANLVSLNLSCASSGSESVCTETHHRSIGNIEISQEKGRFYHKDITPGCKRGTNLLLQPIIQTTVTSDSDAKTLDSSMGIRCSSHGKARKRTKMESKERVDKNKGEMYYENIGLSLDLPDLNTILPSKENSHRFIINTPEKDQNLHLSSQLSQPSSILIPIPTSKPSSHSPTSPQEPSNPSHNESDLPNPSSSSSSSPSFQTSDTDSEPSDQLEPDNIITFQYPIPNIIIQTSSTDSLPQAAPSTKFSINLKSMIEHLAPNTDSPLLDISSADKIIERHELVNIKDSKETEHEYTSHLNWWDNVRTRLIQKYGIDRDRAISEKYARDLRGMRYILKNPFDKSHKQPEERTSVIELISKKIRQTSSISEVNNGKGSDVAETKGYTSSKETKINQTSSKPDRNNAKQEKSKDTKQVESLGSISEKQPRRMVKSFSKPMPEDKNIKKKKPYKVKDQNIKNHHRSSSNSLQADTRSNQPSLIKHSSITQSTKMSLHSRNRSHNRLPSISSKDSSSFTIPSKSNLNSSSIPQTTDTSYEKKAKLNPNTKTDTTHKVLNLNSTISIRAPSHKAFSKHHSFTLKSSSSTSSSEVLSNSMISKISDNKYAHYRDDSFSFPKHSNTIQSIPKSSSPLRPLKSIKPIESYKGNCCKNTLSKKTLSNYKYLAYLDADFNSSSNQLVLLYPDIKVTRAQDLTKAYGVTMETIKNKLMPISASLNI